MNLTNSSIINACKREDLDGVLDCIKRRCNVNFIDEYDYFPLGIAASRSNLDLIKLLIDNGAKINLENSKGVTSLFYACSDFRIDSENFEVIKWLVNHGASIDHSTSIGLTPLMKLAEKGDYKSTKFLLEKGADISSKDFCLNTALYYALKGDKTNSKLIKLLIDYGSDLNVEWFSYINEDKIRDLMEKKVFKSNGYWRVIFNPALCRRFIEKDFTDPFLKELLDRKILPVNYKIKED